MIAFPRSFLLCHWVLLGSLAGSPVATLDLADQPAGVMRVLGHGPENGGRMGVPVCGGFDCDGDGHREAAFAQFLASPFGRPGAGEVTVILGDGTIGGTLDAAVDQEILLRVSGFQPYEATGSEIWMDEVTGDGHGDLLIGRQNHSLELNPPLRPRAGCGALTIVVGSPGWRAQARRGERLDLGAPPPGIKLITFVGPADYDRMGIWFRTGDITGDGIADVVVGADEVDAEGSQITQNQGAAFVIRGGPHLLDCPDVVDLAQLGSENFPVGLRGHLARIDAPVGANRYHLGATVQVGDLDGNGRAEVLLAATLNRVGARLRLPGAPDGTGESAGGARDGKVYIVWDENFPPGLWPENYRFAVNAPMLGEFTSISGGTQATSFGEEILAGEDYSGDGFADLMIGDLAGDPFDRTNAGRAYVIYNVGPLRGLAINLDSPPDGLSHTVVSGAVPRAIAGDTAVHGDFDGDGFSDLAIGSPHDEPQGRVDAGSIHVLYGQGGGWPKVIDLLPVNLPDPAEMRIALVQGAHGKQGGDMGDILCYSAAAGDFNRDGRPDLIVNEMAGNGSGAAREDVGNLLVIDAASLLDTPATSLGFFPRNRVDFGSVELGGGSVTRPLELTNLGNAPLTIVSLSVGGPAAAEFTVASDTGESILGPQESRRLTVRFHPARVGCAGGALLVSTDTDLHAVAIGLAGRGVEELFRTSVPAFSLELGHAVMALQSDFGTDYTLLRSGSLGPPEWKKLFSIPGNGKRLYLVDPGVVGRVAGGYYRVRVDRD